MSNNDSTTLHTVILTGASRGLGAALASQLLSPKHRLICIARSSNAVLEQQARATGAWLDWYLHDLADSTSTANLAASICSEISPQAARYTLINNAGVVDPIGFSESLDSTIIASALNVNVTAAMIFTARFLEMTSALGAQRQVLNISSGAGRHAVEGWSVYCASKAALDMFTRCIKAEQTTLLNGAKVVSLAPGVIDTDMQNKIRSVDEASFPQRQRFIDLHAQAQLSHVDETAKKIIAYLNDPNFGDVEVDDLRHH